MQTVTLTTCDNAAEAHLLQGALANAGIESVLTNEYTASTLPNLCGMMGMGVTVVVLAKDYDRARQLLNTLSPASGQPCCPYCGSTDIGTSLGRRRGLKAFFAFLSLLAWTPLGNIKTSYRCRRCGEDFSKPAPSPGQTPGDRITGTPRTRIRRRNNASVPPRRPPLPRDPLPAPPRKPACTAEPILFPARLAGNEKDVSLSSRS
ncbi:MAG: DUF2007 domain-containing protein [Alistipes indistinctus]